MEDNVDSLILWKRKALDFLTGIGVMQSYTEVDYYRQHILQRFQELAGSDASFLVKSVDNLTELVLFSSNEVLMGSYIQTTFLDQAEKEKPYTFHHRVNAPSRSHFLHEAGSVIYIPLNEKHYVGAIILVWTNQLEFSEGLDLFLKLSVEKTKEVMHLNFTLFSLEELKVKFNAVFHSVSQALIFLDDSGRNAWINAQGRKLLEIYAEEDFISPLTVATHMKVFRGKANNSEEITNTAASLFREPEKEIKDWLWKFPDKVYKVVCSPILNQGMKGRLWVFEDISDLYFSHQMLEQTNEEMKQAMAKLSAQNELISAQNLQIQEKNKVLEQINLEKSGLVSIVSHDLRSPMLQINGLVNLLESIPPKLSEDQSLMTSKISSIAKRSLNLIGDILDISAIEQNKNQKRLEKVNVCEILQEVLEAFQPIADRKNIKIHFQQEILFQMLDSDANSLYRIFENLISNSIKFSHKEKSIYVTIKNKNNISLITIQDEGPGLTEVDKLHLFEKFRKLSAKSTEKEESTGLGLSIVKALVEQLNGKIYCESTWGLGTTFFIEFTKVE